MSIWSLLRLALRALLLIFEHKQAAKQHKQAMNELKTQAGHSNSLQALLDAYKRGDYTTALRANEGLKNDGQLTSSYCFFQGALLMETGQLNEAEGWLRKRLTMETDPRKTALAYSSLGQLLMRLNRYDEAMRCFDEGLQHWPGKGGLHRDMAETVLRRGGDFQQAVQWARLSVEEEANPNSSLEDSRDLNMAENLATLAWAVAETSGDKTEVDQIATRAVPLVGAKSVSSTSQVHYQLGCAYAVLGDTQKTEKHLRAAIEVNPNGIWGRDAKQLMAAVCQ